MAHLNSLAASGPPRPLQYLNTNIMGYYELPEHHSVKQFPLDKQLVDYDDVVCIDVGDAESIQKGTSSHTSIIIGTLVDRTDNKSYNVEFAGCLIVPDSHLHWAVFIYKDGKRIGLTMLPGEKDPYYTLNLYKRYQYVVNMGWYELLWKDYEKVLLPGHLPEDAMFLSGYMDFNGKIHEKSDEDDWNVL